MNGTAARRSPANPAGQWFPAGEAVQYAWPSAADGPHARLREERRRIGIVRQAAYVALDIVLACLGATLVFIARFGFSATPGPRFVSFAKLLEYASAHHYPAYLQLYAALIVLACTSMHLYRTSR